MTKPAVILQGGGEHAKVVLDCLLAQGVKVLGLFDPKYDGELLGVKQLGAYQSDFAPHAKTIVAIGDNALRQKVVGRTSHAFAIAQHPTAIVSPFSQIGQGTMLLHGCIVQTHTRIGQHVIVNTGARIDHDCRIDDYVHIAPGCVLCGTVEIEEGVLVGAGSIILPGIRIGAWATVGAGSVVTKDVPDHAVVVGNPAKIFQKTV